MAGPSSAGSTINAQNSVQKSEMLSSRPISAVPGSGESARLPNAAIVVSALNRTARAVPDCRVIGLSGAPIHHEIDIERHADPEQQRQGDDVGVVKRLSDDNRRRQGQHRGQQQRRDDQRYIAHPPQYDCKQHDDREKGNDTGLQKGRTDQPPGFLHVHRRAGRVRAPRCAPPRRIAVAPRGRARPPSGTLRPGRARPE